MSQVMHCKRVGKNGCKSLCCKIAGFFDENPDEELTFQGLSDKFNAPVKTVRNVVAELVQSGKVESVHVIRLPSKGIAR